MNMPVLEEPATSAPPALADARGVAARRWEPVEGVGPLPLLPAAQGPVGTAPASAMPAPADRPAAPGALCPVDRPTVRSWWLVSSLKAVTLALAMGGAYLVGVAWLGLPR